MKRFLCFLITLTMLITSIPFVAFAEDMNVLSFSYDEETLTATVTDCDESATTVAIPKTVTKNGKIYTITTIGSYAFYSCNSLTSITIPDSVTTIGGYAFCDCDSLTSIEVPDSVITIGSYAFYSCDSLTSVTIPDSVTTIGDGAFYSCNFLTSITIPDSVTTIGEYAFEYCDSLTSVTIPDSVTTIGKGAFEECDSLTSVTIGDSVTTIGENAFHNTDWYNNQPDGLVYAGKVAYKYKGNCPSNVVIKDGTLGIAGGAFYSCDSLTSVTIPDSVTTISKGAFKECDSLTIITIPDSVITIGSYAFSHCSSLTSVTIGDSVTTIGYYAFNGCSSLTSVTIGDSVTTIGNYAFGGCNSLTSVTIPDSVTTIGESAFRDTAWYNNQPDGLVYAGKVVYKYKGTCPSNVVIKDGALGIAGGAFSNCKSLTSITIPDSVITIGSYAFSFCESLTSITMPDSVTIIGDYAFDNCNYLTSVTIPDSVTTIGEGAFLSCTSLTNVYYTGSESDRKEINIDESNEYLIEATWHYNSCIGSQEHSYDNDCDSDCNICGHIREVPDHVYNNTCDSDCNICSDVREITHSYDNDCDSECNICGAVREVPDHIYDDNCDTDCNICGKERFFAESFEDDIIDPTKALLVSKDFAGTEDGTPVSTTWADSTEYVFVKGTNLFATLDDAIEYAKENEMQDANFLLKDIDGYKGETALNTWRIKYPGKYFTRNYNKMPYKKGTKQDGSDWASNVNTGAADSFNTADGIAITWLKFNTATKGNYEFYGFTLTGVIQDNYDNDDGERSPEDDINVKIANLYWKKDRNYAGFYVGKHFERKFEKSGESYVEYTSNTHTNDINQYNDSMTIENVYLENTSTYGLFSSSDNYLWRHTTIDGLYVDHAQNSKMATANRYMTLPYNDYSFTIRNSNLRNFNEKILFQGHNDSFGQFNPSNADKKSIVLENNIFYKYVTSYTANKFIDIKSRFYNEITIKNNFFYAPFAGYDMFGTTYANGSEVKNLVVTVKDNVIIGYNTTINVGRDITDDSVAQENYAIATIPSELPNSNGTKLSLVGTNITIASDNYYIDSDKKYKSTDIIPLEFVNENIFELNGTYYYYVRNLDENGRTADGVYTESVTSDSKYDYVLNMKLLFNDIFANHKIEINVPLSSNDVTFYARQKLINNYRVTTKGTDPLTEIPVVLTLSRTDNSKSEVYNIIVTKTLPEEFSCSDTHYYSNVCDSECNLCGNIRRISGHLYDSICDATCNKCGYSREDYHLYDNASDTVCNECGLVRYLTLTYNSSTMKATISNCKNSVTEITIPESVQYNGQTYKITSIGSSAFNKCTSLTSIQVSDQNQYFSSENGVLFNKDKTNLIRCPSGKSGEYIIPDSVTSIESYAFSYCRSLTSVVIGDSVTSIGKYAFRNCSSLTNVVILGSVTSIGNYAFYDCTSLTNVVIPDSVTSIALYAFALCSNLKNVYYKGSETDKSNISIAGSNSYFTDATWHYNIIIEHGHIYEDTNDTVCNICDFVRCLQHMFDNVCDTVCNECGVTRKVPDHVYTSDCDTDCNECGQEREASDHVYDNACDTDCNECEHTREVPDHVYTSDCDTDCNECEHTREVSDHVYDNACDTDCNECGYERVVPHRYAEKYNATEHWLLCAGCKKIADRAQHEFENVCDSTCSGCSYVRKIEHNLVLECDDNAHWNKCSKCQTVTDYAEHVYDNDCDKNCNVCDCERQVPDHVYDNVCDATCNICESERQVPDHVYDNVCDPDCNECGHQRIISHNYSKQYDDTNHFMICENCKHILDENSHEFDHDYDKTCNGCDYVREITEPEIEYVSVTLNNSLAYKVKVSGIVDSADAKVIFTVGDKTYTVKNHSLQDNLLVFTLNNIAPHLMTEDITAKLVVSIDDEEFFEREYTTTLEQYCLAVVESDASYKEIVNAVLNYGAAAQGYKNYKTDVLANKTLSESEKVIDKKDYFNGLDKEYFINENSLVNWKSAGLYLDSKARIKLSFETEQDLNGITVLVENEWFEKIAELENCIIKQGDRYVFYFDGFNIDELDTIFLFTLYKDGKPISDTLSYSVESYAYRANSTDDSNLKNLMSALMNYGSVAKNY